METQIFHHAKIYIIFIKKNPIKETKNPSRYYNSRTIISSFNNKPKYYYLSKKSSYKNRPIT